MHSCLPWAGYGLQVCFAMVFTGTETGTQLMRCFSNMANFAPLIILEMEAMNDSLL